MSVFYDGWLLPMVYLVGFAIAIGQKLTQKHAETHSPWRIARATTGLGLLGSGLAIISALTSHYFFGLSVDALGLTVALLVAFVGWIVTNYSARYLAGEPNQTGYVQNLLFTIGCVSVLVTSNNLLVMAVVWGASSFSLHRLLTFYPDRKAAQIVAHKKFIACRLADLCMVIALALVYTATGTFALASIQATVQAAPSLPIALQWAMSFVALAAVIRTAQLPLHGWLIQVMEAPTPVSALLHAGIVNMGGFVLIRLAQWLSLAPVAQAILVVVGSLTAALAGLVMMTRVSIKVRLAWSTCAQMGFMLMEIGLGLYELALLHLLAHSLYKSYYFLASGDRVAQATRKDFLTKVPSLGGHAAQKPAFKHAMLWYVSSVLATGALIAVSLEFWSILFSEIHLSAPAAVILALGFAPLLWFEGTRSVGSVGRGIVGIFALTQLYLLWHVCFAHLAPTNAATQTWLAAWSILCITSLYGLQTWLRCYPKGRLASQLYPWAYCGFYLDELFTRLTFKIWPIRLSPIQAQTLVHRRSNHLGGLL